MNPQLHRSTGAPGRRLSPTRPHLRRPLAIVAVSAFALLLPAATASAHVKVHPDSTTTGGYAQLTFRVPNESATAGTVKLEVTLPQDHPLTSVSTTPVAGWSVTVTKAKLPTPVVVRGATITEAPRTVTWTAEKGTEVHPGEYQDFSISVGPLPQPGTLVLPAIQTYSDGTVVRWTDQPVEGQAEPEHPAPSFVVTSASPPPRNVRSNNPTVAAAADDATARWLAGAALAVSVVTAAGLLLSRRRDARTSSHPTTEGSA
jgi:uncharacterized protein YcnI